MILALLRTIWLLEQINELVRCLALMELYIDGMFARADLIREQQPQDYDSRRARGEA